MTKASSSKGGMKASSSSSMKGAKKAPTVVARGKLASGVSSAKGSTKANQGHPNAMGKKGAC